MTTPTTSVIICCFTEERWDDLCAAIESVRTQHTSAYEILVVTDYAPELAARLRREHADVVVVENSNTRGLSGARNTGIACARGEIVAFLDDDAVAEPDWLAELCAPFTHAVVAGVGGRVVPAWDTARPVWFPPEFDWVVGCTFAGHAGEGPIRNTIGASMAFRRSIFDRVGGFDARVGRVEKKPTGCEETELCIRVHQEIPGAVVWYAPGAVVHHRVRAERATLGYFRARCHAEGISKTQVSRLVGPQDGLSSERDYVTRTLPLACVRDVRGTLTRRGERGGMRRIGARFLGLAETTRGFVVSRLSARRAEATTLVSPEPFVPALVATIELDAPEGIVNRLDINGAPYRRVIALVREHGRPCGTIEFPLPDPRGASIADVRAHLDAALGDGTIERAIAVVPPCPTIPQSAMTVVIATRDRPEALARCLTSLGAGDDAPFDVVVVDNAPSDNRTHDYITEHFPHSHRVRYVREPVAGLAAAHNRGLRAVSTPFVAFTDDDVIVDQHWVINLLAAFAIAPDVACVTGMIFPLELETAAQGLVETATGFNKGYRRSIFRLRAAAREDLLFPYAAGRFGSGANMAFRTDALRSFGGFDAALGTGTPARGGDDLAAFFDTVVHGFALVYEPAAIVFHAHRRDEASVALQAQGYGAGLTAYLTRVVLTRPSRALDLVRRIPAGLRHGLAPDSVKNARVPDAHRARLAAAERHGMLRGPWGYLRSRRLVARNPQVQRVDLLPSPAEPPRERVVA